MATINLGRVRLFYKGAWSPTASYVLFDWVTDGGSSYVCINNDGAAAGTALTNEDCWAVLARAGINGTNGTDGVDGADGADGAPGADGADGAPGPGIASGGTVGQVLIKKSATDYDTEWQTWIKIPTGGQAGQVLVSDGADGLTWAWPGDNPVYTP